MKKILYINCESGVSGDMMLGAFINLGIPISVLEEELDKVNLNEFKLEVRNISVGQYDATTVDVILLDEEIQEVHPYSGEFRNYGQIKNMIESSTLSQAVKTLSKAIFDIKAKAEAKVHNVELDKVQFHEAGAVDSIVDIIGTAICYDYFNVDKVISKRVPTGYGEVKCACGLLPVPPPAVRQILSNENIPHYRSNVKQELLTPTGASILAGLVNSFASSWEEENLIKKGFGTGKRKTGLRPLELAIGLEM